MRFSVRTKTLSQAEKILTVAARLFATHRFHEARMEDIAAAAEVGKGTLYRYFHDKEELYTALLSRASEQLSARFEEISQLDQGPVAQLEALVWAVIHYFDEQPHLFDLIQHVEARHLAESQFPWQSTRQLSLRLTRAIFEEGKRTGVFAIEDPELATLLLLGGLRGVIRFGPRPRPADLAARIVNQFLAPGVRSAQANRSA
jgi:AcrR family transcriptional regulator